MWFYLELSRGGAGMRIIDMNWMQVRDHVRQDDRAILPIGSVEQHGYLSLGVDAILAERVSLEAAEPLGVPVYPVISYGFTPNFVEFPGTVTLRQATFIAMVTDVLDSIHRAGFRRIVVVNGHGGNAPAQSAIYEWLGRNPGCQVKWHNWWAAPKTMAKAIEIDKVATHASWMENFPWTRIGNVDMPATNKPVVPLALFQQVDPKRKKEMLGDGNFGGLYRRSDEEMQAIWDMGVAETREVVNQGWH